MQINGRSFSVASLADLRRHLSSVTSEQYREIWLSVESGPAICALMNGDSGWLMYLREEGDSGFSSRNPAQEGRGGLVSYRLADGQIDQYPADWSVSEDEIIQVLEHFFTHRTRALHHLARPRRVKSRRLERRPKSGRGEVKRCDQRQPMVERKSSRVRVP
jgi:hypothetical protein